jgi:kynurenine formamidase
MVQYKTTLVRNITASIAMLVIANSTIASEYESLGMAKHLGAKTQSRCAESLSQANSNSYELSYERSGTMPKSPFAGAFQPKFLPTLHMEGTIQHYNMDVLNTDVNSANQGTQMDALGHFGYDSKHENDANEILYFGGLTQEDVKPTDDSPLLALGAETVPPLVSSGLLIDVRRYANNGRAYSAGEFITAKILKDSMHAQGLSERGILPGDIVLIYTGWSDHYADPDIAGVYYSSAPGLSYDAALFLGEKGIVAAGLDTPFVDSVPSPNDTKPRDLPKGTPPNMQFPVHHHFLTQVGIYTLENLNLKDLADNKIFQSCTMVLPLLSRGSAGSPIRPVAYGAPF